MNTLIETTKEKVSVSVYFKSEVKEPRIFEIKKELEGKFVEVKSVIYVSKEQALEDLLKLAPNMQKAVDVIGGNPLLPSLEIRANSPEQYEIIAKAIENSSYRNEISNVNFDRNREAFGKMNRFVLVTEKIGLSLGIIFFLLAILVTFNTVRVTIYAHRQEFEIMRLVGASNLYVEIPFLIEGMLYGIFAGVVSILLLLITYGYARSVDSQMLASASIGVKSFLMVFLALVLSGILLGTISSSIAIRRYLKK